MIRITEIPMPPDTKDETAFLRRQAAKRLKVEERQIKNITLVKKSVDARKKDDVLFRCSVDVELPGEEALLRKTKDRKLSAVKPFVYTVPSCRKPELPPVVAGFGPAGMFAALLLAQAGQCPVVLERGSSVEERQRKVERFWKTGLLDTGCNVQFGEGGAGTFSDGKLNTGTKDPRARKVLEELHDAGAPAEILYQAHPHVGTDHLPKTVRGIREKILALGGTILFDACLKTILTKDGRVTGVLAEQNGKELRFDTEHLILAIGHSARDTYTMLDDMGLVLAQKPFSVGARIEHPQALIDRAQYGKFASHPALGAAEYKLAVHLPNGRGVYTFCMCPGGEVVAAASEEGMAVTNGMSNFSRDGENANAALLVGITPEEFGGPSPLAGMHLQRRLEQAAFSLGGGAYRAPAQRVEDFLQHRPTAAFGDVRPTYSRGVTPCDLRPLFPEEIGNAMAEGIVLMDRKLRGFAYPDAVLTGVETRSSAPVRILRNEHLQSVSLSGLYPCGEGAGYAGGIVSAAVDGLHCAEEILREFRIPQK